MHPLLIPPPYGWLTLGAHGEFNHSGRRPLSGEIRAAGHNLRTPDLAACLLTDDELVIGNVPKIRDVRFDARPPWRNSAWSPLEPATNPVKLHSYNISGPMSTRSSPPRIRASFLVAGPLLARFGQVNMPPPWRTRSGAVRLTAHLDGGGGVPSVTWGAKPDGDVWLDSRHRPGGGSRS